MATMRLRKKTAPKQPRCPLQHYERVIDSFLTNAAFGNFKYQSCAATIWVGIFAAEKKRKKQQAKH